MDVKNRILLLLRKKTTLSGGELTKKIGISRQALNRHIQLLLKSGVIKKHGSTRQARYYLCRLSLLKHKKFKLTGLKEDIVFESFLKPSLSLKKSSPAEKIMNYAFTEMLNNAIDHSKSSSVDISLFTSNKTLGFEIKDHGIGVFHLIQTQKKLKDSYEAIQELLKGKCTTDPKHHTGEGIFFTSKIVNYFLLENQGLALEIDNQRQDFSIRTSNILQGTKVYIEIARNTKQSLKKKISQYTQGFHFTKTKIYVKLFERGEVFMSRSEAKRLLEGLEKFKEIVLDFHKVKTIGQGFADEIFRVFFKKYPTIKLIPIHMNKEIQFMINRSQKRT